MIADSQSKNNLPGDYGYPVFGELISLVADAQLFYWERYEKYGSIYKTSLLGKKVAVLIGPEINKAVLKDQESKFSSYLGWKALEPLIGRGVLLQDGFEHQRTRKLIYPAFHQCAISAYFTKIKSISEYFFREYHLKNYVNLNSELRTLTLDIIINLLFTSSHSIDIHNAGKSFDHLVEGMRAYIRLDVPFVKYGKALKARKKLLNTLQLMVDEARKNKSTYEDSNVVDFLVNSTDEAGNCLSSDEVITQIFQLVFAGHETTAKLLCWTIISLSINRSWQDKLRNEYFEVVGSSNLCFQHLAKLQLMDAVLKEVERLYPPLYFIPRGIISDFEFAGYTFTPEWSIHLSPLVTHRLSHIYSNPHEFDPERFLIPREEHKIQSYSLIGFGGGKHFCLGNELASVEMKIILSMLLSKYSFDVLQKINLGPIYNTHKVSHQMSFKAKLL